MTTLDALQTALAAEHAALYSYGVLGARTSSTRNPLLFRSVSGAYASHRAQRDALTREIAEAGGSPVAAEPAYVLPRKLATPAEVEGVALEVERAVASAYAWLVAASTGPLRRLAAEALTQTAVRELSFRGTPEMLPGAGELADR